MTSTLDVDGALDEVLDHPPSKEAPAVQEHPEPYVAALGIAELFADHTYQRELDEARVTKMAAAFNIALVGIIEVSARPDGRYAILDGQHRWATVRDVSFADASERHLACRVHVGLSHAEEAALYHQLNTTRRQLTGWDRWLARRGAGDPVVADIESCLAGHGLIVSMRGGGNVFRSTRAAEHVVGLGGIPLLAEVIAVIRAAYPDDQSGLDGSIVHGLGHVLDNYTREELDLERLIAALAGIVPRQLTARASATRELHQGTLDRLVGHVVVERYNASKGTRLEPFFTRVRPVSKTRTVAAKKEAALRERILAWAKATAWEGRHNRLSPKLRAAYFASHPDETPDPPNSAGGGDPVVIQRILAGDNISASQAERLEVVRRWPETGKSLAELERQTGWRVDRYTNPTAPSGEVA